MQILWVFLRGQSSAAPQFSEERISLRIVEQSVDIPGGGLQGLRPVQGSTASSSSSVSRSPIDWLNSEDKAFQREFHPTKVRRSPSARVPRSASSSELSAHQMAWIAACAARPHEFSDDGNNFREDEEKIWIRLDTGQWKLLCTDIVVDQPWSGQWKCFRLSSSTMAWWSIAGLGAWFGSGYMVCVSSCVLLDGLSAFSTHLEIGHYAQSLSNLAVPRSLSGCTLPWVSCARVLRSVSLRQPLEEFPPRSRFARAVRTWKLDTSPLPSYLSVLFDV